MKHLQQAEKGNKQGEPTIQLSWFSARRQFPAQEKEPRQKLGDSLTGGDKCRHLGRLRLLEFMGQNTREKGAMQRKFSRNLKRGPLKSSTECESAHT